MIRQKTQVDVPNVFRSYDCLAPREQDRPLGNRLGGRLSDWESPNSPL